MDFGNYCGLVVVVDGQVFFVDDFVIFLFDVFFGEFQYVLVKGIVVVDQEEGFGIYGFVEVIYYWCYLLFWYLVVGVYLFVVGVIFVEGCVDVRYFVVVDYWQCGIVCGVGFYGDDGVDFFLEYQCIECFLCVYCVGGVIDDFQLQFVFYDVVCGVDFIDCQL